MKGSRSRPAFIAALVLVSLSTAMGVAGCASVPSAEQVRVNQAYDQVSADPELQLQLQGLSDRIDRGLVEATRADITFHSEVLHTAQVVIILVDEETAPSPQDLTRVLDEIERFTAPEISDWSVTAMSPTGATVSLASAADAAGVPAEQVSPFGAISIATASPQGE